jgi:signal transduction histidine kinase
MVYGLIVCQFFIIQYARTRWERMRKLPSIKSRKNASLVLGYLLWLPMSIIWGIAMINLFRNIYQLPVNDSSVSVFPELGLLYFVFVVPFGGFALSQTSTFLNNFFNPIILEKSNQE